MISFSKAFPYTILNTQTNGPICKSGLQYEDMVSFLIAAPAVLPEAITIQVNSLPDGSGVWSTLQDDTPADIAGPLAGKVRFYPQLAGAPAFRLVAGGAVAADRVFTISGPWTL